MTSEEEKHTSIDTLEIEMTCITRQLEYFKLHLKYLENITYNRLNLKTLDAHMRVSRDNIFIIWRNM